MRRSVRFPLLVAGLTVTLLGCVDAGEPVTPTEPAPVETVAFPQTLTPALLAAARSDGTGDVPPPGFPKVPADALSRWDAPWWAMSDQELTDSIAKAGGQVAIGFKEPGTRRGVDTYGRVLVSRPSVENAKAQLRSLGVTVRRESTGLPVVLATIPPAMTARLRENPMVDYVEPNLPGEFAQQVTPWNVTHVRAPQVWPYTTGTGAKLLILDSGVNNTDLNATVISTCHPGSQNDVFNHGTGVAGAAAALNNSISLVGVAHNVTLWSLKIGDYAPVPDEVFCGTEYARSNGAHVVNMSISIAQRSDIFESIRQGYYWSGVTFVAAAGNNSGGAISFPANMFEVVAVNAVNSSNQRDPANSSYGAGIDFAAPGTNVLVLSSGGGTRTVSGTSFAAPHVAAAAALLRSKYPTVYNNPTAIRTRLNNTATFLGSSYEYGYGLLNVERAVKPNVAIAGPASIGSAGTYSWSASPEGGNGSYTYQWSVTWQNSGSTVLLGMAATQSLYIDGSKGSFTLSLTVTSAGVPGYAPGSKFVYNSIAGCGPPVC